MDPLLHHDYLMSCYQDEETNHPPYYSYAAQRLRLTTYTTLLNQHLFNQHLLNHHLFNQHLLSPHTIHPFPKYTYLYSPTIKTQLTNYPISLLGTNTTTLFGTTRIFFNENGYQSMHLLRSLLADMNLSVCLSVTFIHLMKLLFARYESV